MNDNSLIILKVFAVIFFVLIVVMFITDIVSYIF